MASEEYLIRKRRYISEHRRKNYKTMTITFRYDKDMDVINFLDSQPSRQKFIQDAIRAAMEKASK